MAICSVADVGSGRFITIRVNVNAWFGNRALSSYDGLMLFYRLNCLGDNNV